MMDNRDIRKANELAPSEEIIEGEFSAFSGYYCWACGSELSVGSTQCPRYPKCPTRFHVPTPTLVRGPHREVKTPQQFQVMKEVMYGRTTEPVRPTEYHKAKPGWEYGDPGTDPPKV